MPSISRKKPPRGEGGRWGDFYYHFNIIRLRHSLKTVKENLICYWTDISNYVLQNAVFDLLVCFDFEFFLVLYTLYIVFFFFFFFGH